MTGSVVRRAAALLAVPIVATALAVTAVVPASAATTPSLTVARRPAQLSLGHTFLISGAVRPFHPGEAVTLQQFYAGAWHAVSTPKVDSKGTYLFSVKAAKTGIYTYRVAVPKTAWHPAMTTGSFKTVVYFLYIQAIHFVVNGDPNINNEWVVLKNTGTVPVNLASWKLAEARQGLSFVLPAFTLYPGQTVRLHDGKGTSRTGDVYLGSTKRVWSAVHDTASLYNPLASLDMRRAW